MPRFGLLLVALLLAVSAQPASAREVKPKLGSDAVPITERTEHLRTAPAPDYWRLSPFYASQQTSSACSVASIAMALNFSGLPLGAEEPIFTQPALLTKIGDTKWTEEVSEGGSGVSLAEFVSVVKESLGEESEPTAG